jgi:hypothetical protein
MDEESPPGSAPGVLIEETTPETMARVAKRVESAEAENEAERRWLRELLADEGYQAHRRRQLPEIVSGGQAIYACDLWIPPVLLKGQCVDIPFLPCMAERGDSGRINVLPWWIATGLGEELWHPGALGVSW